MSNKVVRNMWVIKLFVTCIISVCMGRCWILMRNENKVWGMRHGQRRERKKQWTRKWEGYDVDMEVRGRHGQRGERKEAWTRMREEGDMDKEARGTRHIQGGVRREHRQGGARNEIRTRRWEERSMDPEVRGTWYEQEGVRNEIWTGRFEERDMY